MKIISIYRDQWHHSDQKIVLEKYYEFFNEYFSAMGNKERFQDTIAERIAAIGANEMDLGISVLEQGVKRTRDAIQSALDPTHMPQCVLFVGEGSWDGNGLIIDRHPYFFVDLSLVKDRLGKHSPFDIQTFLTHEALHALHYLSSPEFYPGNYTIKRDKYYGRMVAEGIASYMSARILGKSIKEALWMGFLGEAELRRWVDYCEESRWDFGTALTRAIAGEEDLYLWYDLFGVRDMSNLAESRSGYYYGYQIARELATAYGDDGLLQLSYADVEPHISRYFAP